MISPRNRSLLIYMAKNAVGVGLSYVLSLLSPFIDFAWCLISVVLVLSPEGTDSMQLAFTRIKANLAGATTGLLLLFIEMPRPYNMAVGAVISLFLCDRLKLNAGAKSTLAAMIIVLMHPEGRHVWDASLARIGAVIIGCFLGLGITFLFHKLFRINTPVWNTTESKSSEKEA